MALRLEEIVVDCGDCSSLARWWQVATGWQIVDEDSGAIELALAPGQTPSMMFIEVAEPKRGKNRLHLDWVPDDQQAEVERLVGLGASRVDIGQGSASWVVLADPEGNEFCVLAAR
ncbi:VOC family protein [Cryobacterium mannosilyticum]|uniref:VOC family protein n=1 Tax=Cryobacterium mannosilyticum TaxID=1259190 RepID=A0A4R8WA17_9MICO|nr:VOC family protein [Cryobacterium mannosilyticum]TFC05286.1 VOC family protein [Cryobacterium mannosilyticum]